MAASLETRRSESALLDVEPLDAASFLQATLDALPALVVVIDEQGFVVAVNRAWTEAEDVDRGGDTGVGANYFDVCAAAATANPDCEAAAVAAGLRELFAGTRSELVVEYPCDLLESPRWFILRAARFAGGGAPCVVMQHQEVTPQRAAQADARFRSRLLDTVDAAVISMDPAFIVTAWNRGAERLFGWTSEDAIGRPAAGLVLPAGQRGHAINDLERLGGTGRWNGQVTLLRRNADPFPARVRTSALATPTGHLEGYVAVAVDHTAQLQAERDLRSAHDYMRAVADNVGEGLCTLDRTGRVVYLNPRGETLLGWKSEELVGHDLHETLHYKRPDGTAFPASECALVAGRTASAGARVDDDMLVRRDGSMLPVEQVQTPFETEDGVGGFVLVFRDISERKARECEAEARLQDLACIERIHDALENDRFVLHAQPIVEISSGRVVQHELLIRMLDDSDSVVPPSAFLPVAENYGLITKIDRWVIREAVRLAAAGHAVELNLSADSLSDPTLYDFVDAELRRDDVDPSLLVFELTETALLHDEDAALSFAHHLGERGCGLALDDFGTGYGGFSYLKRLPVDYLKIDIEFVRDLVSDPASRQVVTAVVNLAQGFGLKTVAEGVEDDETLVLLGEFGVDYAQGYHTGRPAPLHQTSLVREECA